MFGYPHPPAPFADIVGSGLAWPATALVVALLFRTPLTINLKRLLRSGGAGLRCLNRPLTGAVKLLTERVGLKLESNL